MWGRPSGVRAVGVDDEEGAAVAEVGAGVGEELFDRGWD